MARRRLQSRATEKEPLSENGSLTGSLDSVLSLQQYLDDEMFSELDIPKAGPPLEVAKRVNIFPLICAVASMSLFNSEYNPFCMFQGAPHPRMGFCTRSHHH